MLALLGRENINEMNALKSVLAGLINGVAVVTFVIAGAVEWLQTMVMVVGAFYARKLNQRLVRNFIIIFGFAMSLYFCSLITKLLYITR